VYTRGNGTKKANVT